VFPGGVIGLHDHSNRPAILFVPKGSMTVHDDKSDAPTVVIGDDVDDQIGGRHANTTADRSFAYGRAQFLDGDL
jgi:hypothetical protein